MDRWLCRSQQAKLAIHQVEDGWPQELKRTFGNWTDPIFHHVINYFADETCLIISIAKSVFGKHIPLNITSNILIWGWTWEEGTVMKMWYKNGYCSLFVQEIRDIWCDITSCLFHKGDLAHHKLCKKSHRTIFQCLLMTLEDFSSEKNDTGFTLKRGLNQLGYKW